MASAIVSYAVHTASNVILAEASAAASTSNKTGASSGSSASKAATTTKKLKPIEYVRIRTGFWHWYIVAGIVGFLCAVYILRLASHRAQRQRGIQRLQLAKTAGTNTATTAAAAKPTSATPIRLARAITVMFNNFAYIRSFPSKLYEGTNVSEIFFTLAYLGVCVGLTLYKTYQFGGWHYELPFGMMSAVQVPLIIALASKNNIISYLTGISYQNLNYLHRAAGRVCYLFAWIHTIRYCVVGLGKHGPGSDVFYTGVLSLTAFTIAVLTSFALARRIMYETFLVTHIVFILLFLISLYLHRPKMVFQQWTIAGFVLWGADRLAGWIRMIVINMAWLMPNPSKNKQCSQCTVELISNDVVRITVHRPLLYWQPGQHAWITMPSVALLRYEQHPFSFANDYKKGGDAVFIVRAHRGFTRRLVNKMDTQKTDKIACYLEGPYGISHGYNHHDSVVLVAGGTGITHVLSIFLDIVNSHRRGDSAVRSLRLVWNIRHYSDVNWITPLLNEALSTPVEGLAIRIDIHLTKSHASDEPSMPVGLTEAIAEHYHLTSADNTLVNTPAPGDLEKRTRSSSQGEGESGFDTSSLSGQSSSSNEKIDPKKKASGYSSNLPYLAPISLAATVFHSGRSDLVPIFEEEVAKADTTVGVSVCGPMNLALHTRRAVRKVNTGKRVMAGQAPIELAVEKFGW